MTDMIHLAELKSDWDKTIRRKGGHCLVCDRWGKMNHRPLNKTMLRALIWICQFDNYVNVPSRAPKSLIRTNQHTSLKWWGLLERAPNFDPTLKHSGLWRATWNGREFCRGKLAVPRAVWTYNDVVYDMDYNELVTINDFFENFDYQQIMEHTWRDSQFSKLS